MPPTLIRTKDDIYINVPEGMALDAPEVREAIAAERLGRRKRRIESPEFQQKVEEQQAADRKTYDPTEGMSGMDKIRANFGAGVDAAWQGLKQITPGVKSPSDEEVREKRARDERLAQSTQLGIGVDALPTAGSLLQFAGEVAPTLAIPGGPARGVAQKVLPQVLQRTLARPVAMGAIGGAASGALMPTTEDESRFINTALGAGAGAALPAALHAYRARQAIKGPQRRASQRLLEEMGDEAGDVERLVAAREAERAGQTPAARQIPESLTETLGSDATRAAPIESQSARDQVDMWTDFKRRQNVARHGAVEAATGDAPQLAQRMGARAEVTDPMREAALRQATDDQWFHAPAVRAMEAIKASDAYKGNSSVRTMLKEAQTTLESGVTPGSLAELRHTLKAKLDGPAIPGDEVSAAVKNAQKQTLEMIEGIDQALNQASGGKWQRYLDTFQRASRSVDEAEAATLARDVFNDPRLGQLGGKPEITIPNLAAGLRASEGPASRRFPLALSASGKKGMEDVIEQVKRANEPQKARKLAGTAGGGAQTSTDLNAAVKTLTAYSLGGLPGHIVRGAFELIEKKASQATERELAHLLQNPKAAVAALKEAQRLNRPLTGAESALLQAVSQLPGGGLPRSMQQRETR